MKIFVSGSYRLLIAFTLLHFANNRHQESFDRIILYNYLETDADAKVNAK